MIIADLQEFRCSLILGKLIICVDYGLKKLGLAVSDQNHIIAMPLKVVNCTNDGDRINIISGFVKQLSACALIIGLPVMMDGKGGDQLLIVKQFADNLDSKINLPIYLQDERLSSRAANNLLKLLDLNRKKRNQLDDAIAASLILETTLNALKNIER